MVRWGETGFFLWLWSKYQIIDFNRCESLNGNMDTNLMIGTTHYQCNPECVEWNWEVNPGKR